MTGLWQVSYIPFLICFLGIDGSGKTTCASGLVEWLEARGFRAEYVWSRPYSRLMKVASLIIRGLFLKRRTTLQRLDDSQIKRTLVKHDPLAVIYRYFLLFDFILHTILRVWPRLLLRRNVVCDRYIYDVVVDLALDFNCSEVKAKRLLKIVQRMTPKPDLAFLIDLPVNVAFSRKKDVLSINFLRERRRIYRLIGDKCGMVVLDGTKTLPELEDDIRTIVDRLISGSYL